MKYIQTKQDFFTKNVNEILLKYGRYLFEYIAPCALDKTTKQSTSVNDYTLFTNRYVDASLNIVDPTYHIVYNTNKKYVTFKEFGFFSDKTVIIKDKIQNINGDLINKHRKDCKIQDGFYYIERHKYYDYLIIFGTKFDGFDIQKHIFSNPEKTIWLYNIQKSLITLMADMNENIFSKNGLILKETKIIIPPISNK